MTKTSNNYKYPLKYQEKKRYSQHDDNGCLNCV